MNRQMIPYNNKMPRQMNNYGVQPSPYIQPQQVVQPQQMVQPPYILVPNPYYQQQYGQNNQYYSQLGDLSNEEAQKIILEHFEKLPVTTQAQILSEAITGKFDTMSKEVAVAMEKVCTAGVVDKVQSAVSDNQWIFYIVLAFLVGLGAFAIFNKSNARKKK